QYVLVDRIKDTIRLNGQAVSSLEIEADVIAHPQVAEAAALAVPNDASEDEVYVYVVTTSGSELDPAALVEFLAERMDQTRLPRYIEFVDSLPRTPATRKVQKAELRKRGIGSLAWDRLRGDTVGAGVP